MPRRRRKQSLSHEQIRERVDRVMGQWQSYAGFAALLDALMLANDNLGNKELSERMAGATGRSVYTSAVWDWRSGDKETLYSFVEAIVDHNLLNLDPEGVMPGGAQCAALFAAANLIEVTPDSVRQWNEEVLAGHRRLVQEQGIAPKVSWGELMRKLLSFHLQGERRHYDDVAAAIRASGAVPDEFTEDRWVSRLLTGGRRPTEQERNALAEYVGLTGEQKEYIEAGIERGMIPFANHRAPTPFAERFAGILEKLRQEGIAATDLVQHSRDRATGTETFDHTEVSRWKTGKLIPTLEKLRSILNALERLMGTTAGAAVSQADIDGLIAVSGFSKDAIRNTSHDVIARIDGQTAIKPLLRAIHNAKDISLTYRSVTESLNG